MLARKVTSPSTALGWHCAFAPKQHVKVAVAIYVHIVIKYVDALPRSDVTCLSEFLFPEIPI